MPIAGINGVQLHFQRSGAGEPLVLVHGSWVDGRVWDSVVPLLSGAFEVVAYDRRGHSLSSCPPGQGSVRDDVDDLATLIDFLALGPAHVAGASWGDLAAFGGPVLVTHGNRRPPLFKRIVEMVVAVMPGARSEAIPGAAHDPQVTHPGCYAQVIEEFAGHGVAEI